MRVGANTNLPKMLPEQRQVVGARARGFNPDIVVPVYVSGAAGRAARRPMKKAGGCGACSAPC